MYLSLQAVLHRSKGNATYIAFHVVALGGLQTICAANVTRATSFMTR